MWEWSMVNTISIHLGYFVSGHSNWGHNLSPAPGKHKGKPFDGKSLKEPGIAIFDTPDSRLQGLKALCQRSATSIWFINCATYTDGHWP